MATNGGITINGQLHSSATAEVKLAGDIYDGFASFNFKDELKSKKIKGTGARPIGRTRGDYDSDGDCEMYLAHSLAFQAALKAKAKNGSIGLVAFDIVITFDNQVDAIIVIELRGCRFEGREGGFAVGGDEAKNKHPLSIMSILENGIELITKADGGGL